MLFCSIKIDMLDKYTKKLISVIKQLRLENHLTQEQMAFEINISTSYLGMIERGERNISLKNIYEIAKLFKMKPSKLLSIVENELK